MFLACFGHHELFQIYKTIQNSAQWAPGATRALKLSLPTSDLSQKRTLQIQWRLPDYQPHVLYQFSSLGACLARDSH